MVQDTEYLLARELKKLMTEKALDRITVSDLAEAAGINRQTFYYHYHDIYEVVEKIFSSMCGSAFGDCADFAEWAKCMENFLFLLKKEKNFSEHCVRVLSRERMEMILYPVLMETIGSVMKNSSADMVLEPKDKTLISNFYKFALTGIILSWIDGGMQDDIPYLAERIALLVRDGMLGAVGGFIHLS